jgi:hypothetical protein
VSLARPRAARASASANGGQRAAKSAGGRGCRAGGFGDRLRAAGSAKRDSRRSRARWSSRVAGAELRAGVGVPGGDDGDEGVVQADGAAAEEERRPKARTRTSPALRSRTTVTRWRSWAPKPWARKPSSRRRTKRVVEVEVDPGCVHAGGRVEDDRLRGRRRQSQGETSSGARGAEAVEGLGPGVGEGGGVKAGCRPAFGGDGAGRGRGARGRRRGCRAGGRWSKSRRSAGAGEHAGAVDLVA